jgi:hypothetical protein
MTNINATVFRGATTVRHAIADYFDSALPAMFTKCRAAWGLTADQLPYPEVIRTYERELSGLMPSIDISVSGMDQLLRVDYDDLMGEQYEDRYDVMIVTIVKTPATDTGLEIQVVNDIVAEQSTEQAAAMQLRDDIGAVVRNCLLDRLTLGQPDALLVMEETFNERYSDATKLERGNVWAAAVSHSFKLKVDESMVRTGYGVANTIAVDSTTL